MREEVSRHVSITRSPVIRSPRRSHSSPEPAMRTRARNTTVFATAAREVRPESCKVMRRPQRDLLKKRRLNFPRHREEFGFTGQVVTRRLVVRELREPQQ